MKGESVLPVKRANAVVSVFYKEKFAGRLIDSFELISLSTKSMLVDRAGSRVPGQAGGGSASGGLFVH